MSKQICIGIMVAIFGCSRPAPHNIETEKKDDQFQMAQFVVGTWYSKSSDVSNYEIWTPMNDSTLVGRSYSIRNGDTISSEKIRIVKRRDGLAYIPIVAGQNDGLPVVFRSTSITDAAMSFENAEHDFPQQIKYERIDRDSIVAEISGTIKGEHRAIQFPMGRSQ